MAHYEYVLVVDESGGVMANVHSAIADYFVPGLDDAFATDGHTVQYGLCGFASNSQASPRKISVGGGDFGTSSQMITSLGNLTSDGAIEDGWEALQYAMVNYSWGVGSVRRLILITDEDRDIVSGSVTMITMFMKLQIISARIDTMVRSNFRAGDGTSAIGVRYNGNAIIHDPSSPSYTTKNGGVAYNQVNNTQNDYIDLAWSFVSTSWDVSALSNPTPAMIDSMANAIVGATYSTTDPSDIDTGGSEEFSNRMIFFTPDPSNVIEASSVEFNFENAGVDEYGVPVDDIRSHFRVVFYADPERSSIVYSAFSLLDQKRWFVKNSSDTDYTNLSQDGIVVEGNRGVEIIYSPDIQPHDMIEQQLKHQINTENSVTEKPLLCGVVYYVTIEAYYGDVFETISNITLKTNCSNVMSGLWREDRDAQNWTCSGQGQSDLRFSATEGLSSFPYVVSNIYGNFSVVWQQRIGTTNAIYHGVWVANLDEIWSSGQGRSDYRLLSTGTLPLALTDYAQNLFTVGGGQGSLPVYFCPWPEDTSSTVPGPGATTVTWCYPGTDIIITPNTNEALKMRVWDQDVDDSFVISENETIPVVIKKSINLDILGADGTYAIRLRNGRDTDWGAWIVISELGGDGSTAHLIGEDRISIPWELSLFNGIQRVCCQVLTIYGISRTFCMQVLANYSEAQYSVRFYSDSDRTTELPVFEGRPIVSPTHSNGLPQDTTIYLRIFIDADADTIAGYNTSGGLTFNVIQQGINDRYGLALDYKQDNYYDSKDTGEDAVVVTASDGIYNQDGLGIVTVNIPNDSLNLEDVQPGCIQDVPPFDEHNIMNVYANQRDLRNTTDAGPEAVFNTYRDSQIVKVTDINSLKELYDVDDPDFTFGNPKDLVK